MVPLLREEKRTVTETMEDTLDIKAVNDLIRLAEASIEEALDVTNHHQSKEHVKEL